MYVNSKYHFLSLNNSEVIYYVICIHYERVYNIIPYRLMNKFNLLLGIQNNHMSELTEKQFSELWNNILCSFYSYNKLYLLEKVRNLIFTFEYNYQNYSDIYFLQKKMNKNEQLKNNRYNIHIYVYISHCSLSKLTYSILRML